MKVAIIAMTSLLALQGCATITRGTTEDFKVTSEPSQATVKFSTGASCQTPCVTKMKRNKAFTGTVSKPQHSPVDFAVTTAIQGEGVAGLAGNLIVGGVIGMAVDAGSGAMYSLSTTSVHADLKHK